MTLKISFLASDTGTAQAARGALVTRYGNHDKEDADVIVALGGDGFMLSVLHSTQNLAAPVYGMNRGTIGFLMSIMKAGWKNALPKQLRKSLIRCR
jgi:NAD+ kinase